MEEFVNGEIERRQEEIARKRGFTIKELSLAMYGGTCAACASALLPDKAH